MSQSLHAVLFDMDGTLVQSEERWGEAMAALAQRLGGRLSAAARTASVGSSMRAGMGLVYDDLGIRRSEEQMLADIRWVEDAVAELMADGVALQPGAAELLAAVRAAGLRSALVTATQRHLADVVLEHIGPDNFDLTICGDEVPAPKPDPAPYRQAMAGLGVVPAGCVVVEDSLTGVAAGLASGAAVIAVPSLQVVPAAPGLTVRSSLVGVGLAELQEALTRRDLASAGGADPA